MINSLMGYLKPMEHEDIGPLIESYKKEMAYQLIRRDLEIVYKEMVISELIGDFSLISEREDELLGINGAICLLFNCLQENLDGCYQELFVEGLCFGFFDMVNERKLVSIEVINTYAQAFADVLYELALRKITNPFENKERAFFEVFNFYFPDQKIKHFEKNYKGYLKAN